VISDDVDAESMAGLIRRMDQVLGAIGPDVVAVPGWSHRAALAALLWSQRRGVPAILMSESTAADVPRWRWKEVLKRRIVSLFSAALAGGQPQCAYLLALGMRADRVFDGYDVVDNDHFARQADAAREHAAEAREQLGLPARYFLANGRFVEKKNLFRLLEAFARYRSAARAETWDLVLLGDGELRPKLLDHVARLGLQEAVHLPGFQQYEELPAYYGLAEVFVHASTTEHWGLVVNEDMAAGLHVLVSNRCGCADDLVVPGANGYTFDPLDPDALAGLMSRLVSAGCDRRGLARAGADIIAGWTTQRFAQNLRRAAAAALAAPRSAGAADRLLLRTLLLQRESH
jgi:glycosyltransferase involved in cell wall biosynthesis